MNETDKERKTRRQLAWLLWVKDRRPLSEFEQKELTRLTDTDSMPEQEGKTP